MFPLVFVVYHLFSYDNFFMLYRFFLNAFDSQGALDWSLRFIGMCTHLLFLWGRWQTFHIFHFLLVFRCLLKSDKHVSYTYRILMSSGDQSYRQMKGNIVRVFESMCLVSWDSFKTIGQRKTTAVLYPQQTPEICAQFYIFIK